MANFMDTSVKKNTLSIKRGIFMDRIENPLSHTLSQISVAPDREVKSQRYTKKKQLSMIVAFGLSRGTVTRTQDPLVPNQMR